MITGETGAGKTILAQAFGLLLGTRAMRATSVRPATTPMWRPSSTCPPGFLADDGLEALVELRPADEDGLVLARRVFGDGRTRAYAWGRGGA